MTATIYHFVYHLLDYGGTGSRCSSVRIPSDRGLPPHQCQEGRCLFALVTGIDMYDRGWLNLNTCHIGYSWHRGMTWMDLRG